VRALGWWAAGLERGRGTRGSCRRRADGTLQPDREQVVVGERIAVATGRDSVAELSACGADAALPDLSDLPRVLDLIAG
jgi:hypothetical protein